MAIRRTFTEDWSNMVSAIKSREEYYLIDRFQEYWKERCDNQMFLSYSHVLSLLMDFAKDNFLRSDWYQYNEYFRFWRVVENNETIPVLSIINAYLTAILLMRMVFDSEEQLLQED